MARHPQLSSFVIDESRIRRSGVLFRSQQGQCLLETVMSLDAMTGLVGAIEAAPTCPPHPALDRYLIPALGLDMLNDEMLQLCGRIMRQAIEGLGGQHVRKGVPIRVASIFANGSTYMLPNLHRGKLSNEGRHTWLKSRLATHNEVASERGSEVVRKPGALHGRIWMAADFDHLPPDELAAMEGVNG